jgi:NTE family protein
MTSTTTLTPRRGGKVCLSLALLIGAALVGDAWAAETCGQPKEVTGRPRIGLALAGGGGKGWAHIGVLKVLEQLRVPIDCIAGTSAGSIIGGVYASGLSPEEMEKIVLTSDWGAMFTDSAPRQEQSFERKREDLRGLWDLELGVGKGGVKVPSGIFAGQEVNALLRRMTTSAVGVRNFDDLQIPFRAVATDLKTGDLVVLDHGELAAAMRASMAVPGAFTPETIDGRLLVDGGLRQNLPVPTVRAMGADVIIAVDLGTTATPTDAQLANPLAVTQQMINILLDLNVYASRDALKPSDVYISPQVQGFSSGDFTKGAELVPIGEKAARAAQDKLLALSLPEQQYAAVRQAQRARSKAGSQVARVEVDASQLRHVNPAYVKKKFAVDERSGELDEQRVRDEVGVLLGEGDYERIDYYYEDQADGQRALLIAPREKPWGPGYLRLGLQLATDFKEDTYFNLIGSYRRNWINSLGAQWRNDFSLGQTTGLRSELYQPVWLGKGLFVAPILAVSQTSQNLFVGNQPVASYRIQSFGGELDLGWTFGRYAELRVGIERAYSRYDPSIAVPAFPPGDFSTGSIVGTFNVDRLDSASFPRSGYLLGAMYRDSVPGLGADVEYQKAVFGAMTAFSTGRHTVQLELKGGGAIEGELPIYDLVYLGGLFNLSGYLINQLQGQKSVLGRAAYYYRLADVPVLLKGLYAGVSLEAGQVYGRLDGSPATGLLPSAALFIGADSALGPLYLAFGHAFDAGLSTIYFYLGTFY